MFEKQNGGPSGWSEINKDIVSDAESEKLRSVSEGANNISFTTESTASMCSRYMSWSMNKTLVAWRSEEANTTRLQVLRSYVTVGAEVDTHLPLSRGAEVLAPSPSHTGSARPAG